MNSILYLEKIEKLSFVLEKFDGETQLSVSIWRKKMRKITTFLQDNVRIRIKRDGLPIDIVSMKIRICHTVISSVTP